MRLLARVGLLLATMWILALLAEGVLRLLDGGVPDPRLDRDDLPELHTTKDLSQPNLEAIVQGAYYRTNAEGLRGPDYSPEPAPGTFRILIAGDSVTMGWGVSEEASYPYLLAQMLEQARPDPVAGAPQRGIERFEVINAGLAGVGANFANERIRRFSRVYQPHLTIYGFTLNDIEGPRFHREVDDGSASASRASWVRALRFRDSPSHLLRELWPRLMLLLDPALRETGDGADPETSVLHFNYFRNPRAWADFAAALDVHAEVAAGRGRCGHVFVHSQLGQLDASHPYRSIYERVEKASLRRGLSVTQSLRHLDGHAPESLWLDRFDPHPNAAGHAILAQALFDGLGQLDPACFRLDRVDGSGS